MAQADTLIREQLAVRRDRLEAALPGGDPQIVHLLAEVDGALARLDTDAFGLCEVCHVAIETDRLAADPLQRYCIECLSQPQRLALEHDLATAFRIQSALLPPPHLAADGWQVGYSYRPAGPVSGDYCDLIPAPEGGLFFLLGDVSGKGVSASLLMSHLHALFRSLVVAGAPLPDAVAAVNRMFCESTLPSYFATVVCGRAEPDGSLELVNAGHPSPLLVAAAGEVRPLAGGGLPLGLFCNGGYSGRQTRLEPGEALVLVTDGLLEATDAGGEEYGQARLEALLRRQGAGLAPGELAAACASDLAAFQGSGSPGDDLTIMVLQRATH